MAFNGHKLDRFSGMNCGNKYDAARGARLSAAMIANGQKYNCQLSYDLGITESSLSRWRGGGPMSVSRAVSLAQHLNVTLDWLIMGRTSQNRKIESPNLELGQATHMFVALTPNDRELVLTLTKALASAKGFDECQKPEQSG